MKRGLKNRKVWFLLIILLLALIASIFFAPKLKLAPPLWKTWLIADEQTITEDENLAIRTNIEITNTGKLNILGTADHKTALTFSGLEGDELSLRLGQGEEATAGQLFSNYATISSQQIVRLSTGLGSVTNLKDSKFINVIVDEQTYGYIIQNVDVYWYTLFEIIDSNGVPVNGAYVDVDGVLQDPYTQPFEVYAKTLINSIDEYFIPSIQQHSIIVGKAGYTSNDSLSGIIIDTPNNKFILGINYIPAFNGQIQDQQWLESEGGLTNIFNINDYFLDLDHNLIYSVQGNTNINVIIGQDGLVSFNSPPGWTGVEIIKFRADELNGNLFAESNSIRLEVLTDPPFINLISPIDYYTETQTNEIDFIFNAAQGTNNLNECWLTVNDGINDQVFGPQPALPGENTFANINLINDDYTWFVTCNDVDGVEGVSEIWHLTINVITQSISISFSNELMDGISWEILSLPINNQPAEGNNNEGATLYDVHLSSNVPIDVYIKADGDLHTLGEDTILLANEKFSYSLTDNTVPSENKFSLTTNYIDNKIVDNIVGDKFIYLKFFLSASGGQAPGDYSNNVQIAAVPHGENP